MLNRDLTGDRAWLFLLALTVIWLIGPVTAVTCRRRSRNAKASAALAASSILVGVLAFALNFGAVAAAIDVTAGWMALTVRRRTHAPKSGKAAELGWMWRFIRLPRRQFMLACTLIAVLSLGSIVMPRLRHNGASGIPDRITVAGRAYAGPGTHYTRVQMREYEAHPVAVAQVTWRNLEVWVVRPGVMNVYVRTGSDDFRGYSMLGGP